MSRPVAPVELYVVEVDDRCAKSLIGHTGCTYASPPQPSAQALSLVRILLSCPQRRLLVTDSPWTYAIAGGQRTIRLHQVEADGQLTLAGRSGAVEALQ